jgi:D-beta-D-heptose 7-phosphate kinase / D-beta-D-heptose 1-phosphate adenosyltransferase
LKNIAIFVDPKGGDFDRYCNSTLITPNLREFEEIVGSSLNDDEFVAKALTLKNKLGLAYLIVTLGPEGVFMLDDQNNIHRISSEARQVYDVSGAGDTIIAVLAALVACDYKVEDALGIANIAAGLAVAKVGTSVVTYHEISSSLYNKDRIELSLYGIEELFHLVEKDKLDRKTIVMTNGCFDILHAGHVTYLEAAAKLGDILIVAINSDASVTRLKGKSRPVNLVESRAKVLAGLKAVDYVVSFDEDTPKKLYELIKPDILVKGSDYSDKEIIGADVVTANGGSVRLLDFVEGHSTTSIIERIQRNS